MERHSEINIIIIIIFKLSANTSRVFFKNKQAQDNKPFLPSFFAY